jgi:hypothetical protein
MTEEVIIIQMNIARYGTMLKHEMDEGKRLIVVRLLAELQNNLGLANGDKEQKLPLA